MRAYAFPLEEICLMDTTPPVHLRLRGTCDEVIERRALRAVLDSVHLLGLAAGTHLSKLREMNDPLTELQARLEQAELRAHLACERADVLAARFARIPQRHRPYYTPAQRFRILEIRNLLAWSAQETAGAFLVCPNTILNWEQAADPEANLVGSTLKPVPPLRRAADVVRALVQTMTRLGMGGQDLVARTLARAGWNVSARSVGRYRKERLVPPPDDAQPPAHPSNPVRAHFVNHVWMMDVSEVKQLLGPSLQIAAVFDAFSRVPLALRVFDAKPGARDMVQLLKRAVAAFGSPKYLITDRGGEFVAGAFRKAVSRFGIVQRFAAADSLNATARLERFWRTLKETARLRGLWRPLDRADLERRLDLALLFYVCFRPHEGLQGATPAEAFLGIAPAHLGATEPPRGRPGEGPRKAPFQIDYLDPKTRSFPILKAAA